ncbi:histidine kinase [Vibrio zhugei]|uniref:Sensor protein n=1 Tax=Vibrio zhugei TaxID=2479546 RepID=A0ABV7C906_9VIBR|nr:histidine kinase [Vibrio zhugei]
MFIDRFQAWCQCSFVKKISIIIVAFSLLSTTGMIISAQTSKSIQGNAHMINRVGAMRMQSYRILAFSEPASRNQARAEVQRLQAALTAPTFTTFIADEHFVEAYDAILQLWQSDTKNILLSSADSTQKRQAVEALIAKLNVLISQIDQHTENNIRAIATTQHVFFLLTLVFLFLAFSALHKHLFTPWRALLHIANAVREGDFNQRFQSRYDRDEMAVLGNALNDMSSQLKQTYDDLEQRVHTKTQELERQNQYLDFLYRSGRSFNRHRLSVDALASLFNELMLITNLQRVTFYPGEHLRYVLDKKMDYQSATCQHATLSLMTQSWPVSDDSREYGRLETMSAHAIPTAQKQLIATFCDSFTQYLGAFIQEQQTHQLLVLEERQTIARELHDSIAQSLSFLKIKSGILRIQSDNLTPLQHQLLEEISQEITSAYHQLRELLVTFRLKLDEGCLANAIQNTITEYNEKLGFAINLRNEWPEHGIQPQQAIHILHIIREALSNIYKHSGATEVMVSLRYDRETQRDKQCTLTISDNGVGISQHHQARGHHYGLTIIADRVNALPGQLNIDSQEQQGTRLLIRFSPSHKDEYEYSKCSENITIDCHVSR